MRMMIKMWPSFSLMILLVAGIFLTEVDSHPQQGLQLRYKRIPFYSTHLEMQRGRFRPREAKQNDFSKESNDDFRYILAAQTNGERGHSV